MKIKVETTRFGPVEVNSDEVYSFPQGLIGFEALKRFVLLDSKKGTIVQWLQAVDDPAVAFLVSEPQSFIPSFEIEFPDATASEPVIDRDHFQRLKTLTMLSLDRNEGVLHVHVMSPLLLDTSNRKGVQIMTDTPHPTVIVPLRTA